MRRAIACTFVAVPEERTSVHIPADLSAFCPEIMFPEGITFTAGGHASSLYTRVFRAAKKSGKKYVEVVVSLECTPRPPGRISLDGKGQSTAVDEVGRLPMMFLTASLGRVVDEHYLRRADQIGLSVDIKDSNHRLGFRDISFISDVFADPKFASINIIDYLLRIGDESIKLTTARNANSIQGLELLGDLNVEALPPKN